MALSKEKKASLQIEFEFGKASLTNMAKRYKIAISTITRMAKRSDWERGRSLENAQKAILKKAEEKFIGDESDRLAKFTEKHIEDINSVRMLTRLNLDDVLAAAALAKEDNTSLHREVSENFFALQKICKIASETLSNCYREERLAMGMGKEEDAAPSVTIENRIVQRMLKIKINKVVNIYE